MQRYTKLGFSIVVDIGEEGFVVRADILKHGDKTSNSYVISFYLGKRGYDWWKDINKDDPIHFPVTMASENINMDVSRLIMTRFHDGCFTPHMEIYDYYTWCLYEGDKVLRRIDI